MRKTLRTVLCGFLLHAAASLSPGAAMATGCTAEAIDVLRGVSASGSAILARVEDPEFLRAFLDCTDAQFGLPTAVHEAVHLVTAEDDAYPLVGGGSVARPPEDKALFAPGKIARRFGASLFVDTYLRPGAATAAEDVRYLLDELNAYTHDLDAAVALDALRDPDVRPSHRDGLAALMSFVAVYVEVAEGDPSAWDRLRRPALNKAVSTLWGQAERTMAASCRIPDIGTEDRGFLRRACAPGPRAALGRMLGRAPLCPAACLDGQRTASRE